MSTYKIMQDTILFDFFAKSDKITIYRDGKPVDFENSSPEYEKILGAFQDTIFDAYEMPAFGVSLHDETMKARANGVWLEFHFPEEQEHNSMPFSTMLIQIAPNDCGFNLIRQHDGRYEGRCFYLNLIDKDMSAISAAIEKVIK